VVLFGVQRSKVKVTGSVSSFCILEPCIRYYRTAIHRHSLVGVGLTSRRRGFKLGIECLLVHFCYRPRLTLLYMRLFWLIQRPSKNTRKTKNVKLRQNKQLSNKNNLSQLSWRRLSNSHTDFVMKLLKWQIVEGIQSGWLGRQSGCKLWSRGGLLLQNGNTDFIVISVFFLPRIRLSFGIFRYFGYRLPYRYIPQYSVSVTDPSLNWMHV